MAAVQDTPPPSEERRASALPRSMDDVYRLFSRVTSGREVLRCVDGLRFAALLHVVLYHVSSHLRVMDRTNFGEAVPVIGRIYVGGGRGVLLFFVISGFILGLPFARAYAAKAGSAPSIRKYFLRRLSRIEPPYIIMLVLFLAMRLVQGGHTAAEYLNSFLASVFYSHCLVYKDLSLLNTVTWSLEIEVQFYILAPLLARVFLLPAAWRRGALVAAIAAAALFRDVANDSFLVRTSLLGSLHFFLLGFLLADLFLARGEEVPRGTAWDLAGLLGWGWIYFSGGEGTLLLIPAMAVAFLSAIHGRWINAFFSLRPVYTIGGMCYTFYLFHYVIISQCYYHVLPRSWFAAAPPLIDLLMLTAVSIPAIVLICPPLFLLMEKPFMYPDWPARLKGWLAPSKAPATTGETPSA